jgi:hypothetical protein
MDLRFWDADFEENEIGRKKVANKLANTKRSIVIS